MDESRSETESQPRGLFAQLGATRDSMRGLAMAHVDLAKAEAAAIGGRIARVAALAGVAVALILAIGMLLIVGLPLFTAEWLLGSMGWGILHAVLVFAGVATAAVLAAVGMSASRIARALLGALVIGVVASVVLGLELLNRAWAEIGTAVLPGIDPGPRPLVVGIVIGALIGLVAGVVIGRRVEPGSRGAAVFGPVVAGILVGAFSAITFGLQPGVGVGAAIGWTAWIAIMAADIAATGVDMEALKARFLPTTTIETSKETFEWLKSKMPPGTGS